MPSSRALLTAAVLVAVTSVPAAPAAAQTAPDGPAFTARVSPSKAGTRRKPAGATLRLGFDLPESARKTPTRITVRVPPGMRLSAAGLPAGTPVGAAVVEGVLSTSPPTPVSWTARITVASASRLALSFKGLAPALSEAVLSGHGRRLRVDVPREVRAPLDGVSTYVTGVSLSAGATRTAGTGKKRRTFRLATYTACPADRTLDLAAEVAYARNDAGSGGTATRLLTTARCRR